MRPKICKPALEAVVVTANLAHKAIPIVGSNTLRSWLFVDDKVYWGVHLATLIL